MLDGIGTDAAAVTASITAGRQFGGIFGAIKATMGAGYGDGSVSAWTSAGWVALTAVGQPGVVSALGSHAANVIVWDVENGDLSPDQGVGCAKASSQPLPVLYCNRSNK